MGQLRYFEGAKPGLKPKRPLSQPIKTKVQRIGIQKEKDPCKNHGKMDAHGFNSILKINQ